MRTGWVKNGSSWYYCNKSGVMLTNTWVSGKYWVGSDGAMVTNAWVDGGKYWVGSDGKYNANKKHETETNKPVSAPAAA